MALDDTWLLRRPTRARESEARKTAWQKDEALQACMYVCMYVCLSVRSRSMYACIARTFFEDTVVLYQIRRADVVVILGCTVRARYGALVSGTSGRRRFLWRGTEGTVRSTLRPVRAVEPGTRKCLLRLHQIVAPRVANTAWKEPRSWR